MADELSIIPQQRQRPAGDVSAPVRQFGGTITPPASPAIPSLDVSALARQFGGKITPPAPAPVRQFGGTITPPASPAIPSLDVSALARQFGGKITPPAPAPAPEEQVIPGTELLGPLPGPALVGGAEIEEVPERTLRQSVMDPLAAVGRAVIKTSLGGVGGALEAMGEMPGTRARIAGLIGKPLSKAADWAAEPPEWLKELGTRPDRWTDPNFIAALAMEGAGSTAASFVPGLAAGKAVKAAQAMRQASPMLKAAASWGAGTSVGAFFETLTDAGLAFSEAVDRGVSREKAAELFRETINREMPVTVGMSLTEFLPVAKGGIRKALQWGFNSLMEGGEEVAQGAAQRSAENVVLGTQKPLLEGAPEEFVGGTLGATVVHGARAAADRFSRGPQPARPRQRQQTRPAPETELVDIDEPEAGQAKPEAPREKPKAAPPSPPTAPPPQAGQPADVAPPATGVAPEKAPAATPEPQAAKPEAKKEGFDYASTQTNLPQPLAGQVRQSGAQIPDAELAEKGRENQPHITVKYGLHEEDPAPEAAPAPAAKPPRPPAKPAAQGRAVTVSVPGEQTRYQGQYEVRELDDVQPSHNAFSFEPNPQYEHQNDRDYKDPNNAARVLTNATPDKFDPSYIVTESPTAEHGAPIIDDRGNVLGGNNRAMTLKRVHQYSAESAARYRQAVIERAEQLGIDRAEVEGMKNPVLVRRVAAPNPQNAITDFNKKGSADLRPSEKAVTDGKRMSPKTVEKLVARIEDQGEGASLADALRGDEAVEVIDSLIADGVITEQEKAGLLDDRDFLTAEAKARIAKALVGRLFPDAASLNRVKPEMRNKLERIAPQVLRTEGRQGWRITDALAEALALIEDAQSHGTKRLEDVANQTTIEGRRYSPAALALAKAIQQSPNKAAAAFRRYANDEALSRPGAQSSMFEPPTQEEAFRDAFDPEAVPVYDRKLRPGTVKRWLERFRARAGLMMNRPAPAASAVPRSTFRAKVPEARPAGVDGVILINSAMQNAIIGAVPGLGDFRGVTVTQQGLRNAIPVIRRVSPSAATQLEAAMNAALKGSPVTKQIALVVADSRSDVEQVVRHERVHLAQGEAPGGLANHVDDKFLDHPLAVKALAGLRDRKGYDLRRNGIASAEIAAHLAAGQWTEIGMTEAEAFALLDHYLAMVEAKHGAAAVDGIIQISGNQLLEARRDYARRQRQQQQPAGRSEPELRGQPPGARQSQARGPDARGVESAASPGRGEPARSPGRGPGRESLTRAPHAGRVTGAIQRLRGGSQAWLVTASDGKRYVCKHPENPQGRNIPVNEIIATKLMQALGLPVPKVVTLDYDGKGMGYALGTRQYDYPAGMVVGSEYVVPEGRQSSDMLPKKMLEANEQLRGPFVQAFPADQWLNQGDARQAVFFRDADGRWQVRLIDHGYVFNGNFWDRAFPEQGASYSGTYFDPAVYNDVSGIDSFDPALSRIENLDDDLIREIFDGVPEALTTQWGREQLKRLAERLIERKRDVRRLIEERAAGRDNPFRNWTGAKTATPVQAPLFNRAPRRAGVIEVNEAGLALVRFAAAAMDGGMVHAPGGAITLTRTEARQAADFIDEQPALPTEEKKAAKRLREAAMFDKPVRCEVPNAPPPPFFSQLKRIVQSKMPVRASAAQVRAIVQNPQNGVKAEEVKWTGFDEFLQAKGSGTVTREECLGHLDANDVQIEEVPLRGADDWYRDLTLEGVRDDYTELLFRWNVERVERPQVVFGPFESEGVIYDDEWVGGPPEWVGGPPESPTRFSISRMRDGTYRAYDRAYGMPEIRGLDSLEQAKAEIAYYAWREQEEFGLRKGRTLFSGPHFGGTTNILAHARYSGRVAARDPDLGVGADGEPVLHVEEIQSDWHQAGRKGGYRARGKPLSRAEEIRFNQLLEQHEKLGYDHVALARDAVAENDDWANLYGVTDPELVNLGSRFRLTSPRGRGVPEAPMSKTWHEFVFRRMVRHAAENGFRFMTWTTGRQQADRYNLRHYVDRIEVQESIAEPGAPAMYLVDGFRRGTHLFGRAVDRAELAELIGEDLAKRAMREIGDSGPDRFVTLEDTDLEIGGEGMAGFYDQILPQYAAKFARKFGAKTGKLRIRNERALESAPGHEVHFIEVNPAMRESVLEGQPLFDKPVKRRRAEESGQQSLFGEEEAAPRAPRKPAPEQGSLFTPEEQAEAEAGARRDREQAQKREAEATLNQPLARRAGTPGGLFDEQEPLFDKREAGFSSPELFGADLIARGVASFSEWAKRMTARFGPGIRARLGQLWTESKELARALWQDEAGTFNPGAIVDAIKRAAEGASNAWDVLGKSLGERIRDKSARLADMMEHARDVGDVMAGGFLNRLIDAEMLKLSRAERFLLLDVLEGRTRRAPRNVVRAYRVIRSLTDDTAQIAVALGVQVRGRQGRRTFVPLRDYFPHVMRRAEALKSGPVRRDVVENLTRLGHQQPEAFLDHYIRFLESGVAHNRLLDHLVQSGQAANRAEALDKLRRFRQASERHGSLEYAREIDLPFYDPDPARVLPWHFATAGERLAQIAEFGQDDQAIKAELLAIAQAGENETELRRMVEKSLRGVDQANTAGERLSRFVRMMQVWKLGLAFIPNATQAILNIPVAGDFRALLAGYRALFSRQGRRFAIESGAAIDPVLAEAHQLLGEGILGRAAEKFLKPFTAVEQHNRIVAAQAGADFAFRMHRLAQAGGRRGRWAARKVRELGLDPAQPVTREGLLMAAKRFSDLTQFRTRPEKLPDWATEWWGKILFQFKTFAYQQARFTIDQTVGELRQGSPLRAGRNLLVLGLLSAGLGELVRLLRNAITGREDEPEGIDRLAKDWASVGAAGIALDAVQAAGRNKLTEWLAGPGVMMGVDAGELGADWLDTERDVEEKIEKTGKVALRHVPLGSIARRFVED